MKAQRLESLTNKDKALLDLGTEESCGFPCPGDCEVKEDFIRKPAQATDLGMSVTSGKHSSNVLLYKTVM